MVRVGHAAPNLVATLNIGAFNVGNALGAWVGGSVIDHGLGLTRVPLAAAALAALALLAHPDRLFRKRPRPGAAGPRLIPCPSIP